MIFVLILLPIAVAILALLVPSNRWRPWLLSITGSAHLVTTILLLFFADKQPQNGWIFLDPLGKVLLLGISVLYFFSALYTAGYLQEHQERSNRIFTAALSAALGLGTLVIFSHHLGLMWVAVEGTTLISAPLIYFNQTKRSIEATWKYLLIGSVGIALALLGTFFLAFSAAQSGNTATLAFTELLTLAPKLSKPWLYAAFILLLVGFGTKIGLAPMHTWKPDAYGESPGVVGAIFAGGVSSIAFLALTRVYQITLAAGEMAFMKPLLLFLGFFSMFVAAIFMINQHDLKRMLAYSSVEHMGILAIGLGLGGSLAIYGTIMHIINNMLTKGVLFMSAGNIQRVYGSKLTPQVRGALRVLPFSGYFFLAGFIAITGSPPFAPFVSELTILQGAFSTGQYFAGAALLLLLMFIFLGMGKIVLSAVLGSKPTDFNSSTKAEVKISAHEWDHANPLSIRNSSLAESIDSHRLQTRRHKENFFTVTPIALLLFIVLLLGVYIPEPLQELLQQAANFLENKQ